MRTTSGGGAGRNLNGSPSDTPAFPSDKTRAGSPELVGNPKVSAFPYTSRCNFPHSCAPLRAVPILGFPRR
jgi:hypothetical protein